jgi:hypothetical protein
MGPKSNHIAVFAIVLFLKMNLCYKMINDENNFRSIQKIQYSKLSWDIVHYYEAYKLFKDVRTLTIV